MEVFGFVEESFLSVLEGEKPGNIGDAEVKDVTVVFLALHGTGQSLERTVSRIGSST